MLVLNNSRWILIFVYSFMLQLFIVNTTHADVKIITQQELLERIKDNDAPLLLDVRRPDEYAAGHIRNSINIPHTELETRLDEIRDRLNKDVVVYCESGRRAGIAIDVLKKAGFTQILHLDGDMKAWRAQGLPLEGMAP